MGTRTEDRPTIRLATVDGEPTGEFARERELALSDEEAGAMLIDQGGGHMRAAWAWLALAVVAFCVLAAGGNGQAAGAAEPRITISSPANASLITNDRLAFSGVADRGSRWVERSTDLRGCDGSDGDVECSCVAVERYDAYLQRQR